MVRTVPMRERGNMKTAMKQHLTSWVEETLYEDEQDRFVLWVEILFLAEPELNDADISWRNLYNHWKAN